MARAGLERVTTLRDAGAVGFTEGMSVIPRTAPAVTVCCGVSMAVTGCTWSTTGYGYSGPADVFFGPEPPTDLAVFACLGGDSEPAVVNREDGAGPEPQETPFLAADTPGTLTTVRAVAAGTGVDLDVTREVPIRSEGTGVLRPRSGPLRFEPVVVSLVDG